MMFWEADPVCKWAFRLAVMIILANITVRAAAMLFTMWAETGPNCPAPVPADWLGYCADYQSDR